MCQPAARFETETCSRCHGTGEHSYCERFGTRCFKCMGKRVVLTKRGEAAVKLYKGLVYADKLASEIVTGDVVIDTQYGNCTVTSIEKNLTEWKVDGVAYSATSHTLRTDKIDLTIVDAHSRIRTAVSAETKAEARARALAYQATLTKQGTPRKGR